jgi:hypothetical protein
MKTKTINLYEFKELSKEAKQHAIDIYYENIDWPSIRDQIKYKFYELLPDHILGVNKFYLWFSLMHRQGDGLMFTGEFLCKGQIYELVLITHIGGNYYCKNTAKFNFYNKNSAEIHENLSFKNWYYSTCDALEKYAYSIIDYRMDEKEFEEFSRDNDFFYNERGELDE